jgi:hypothetical protein
LLFDLRLQAGAEPLGPARKLTAQGVPMGQYVKVCGSYGDQCDSKQQRRNQSQTKEFHFSSPSGSEAELSSRWTTSTDSNVVDLIYEIRD